MRIVPESKCRFQPGQRLGMLTVLGKGFYLPESRQSSARFVCECECGNVTVIRGACLVGGCVSCGCRRALDAAERFKGNGGSSHPNFKHGGALKSGPSRLYRIWQKMRRRCSNQSDPKYPSYGGRGIRVCQEWDGSFAAFERWSLANGYLPTLTIDRSENDGDYSPENCRWADDYQQANNRRSSRFVEAFGERKTVAQWSRDSRCISEYEVLRKRLNQGMDAESAMTEPLKK